MPFTKSLAFLILANLIPLVGVLALDWNVASVLGVYWLETLVIGGFTVLRILTCAQAESTQKGGMHKFALAPFFAVHFGLFAFVHGVFLTFLLGLDQSSIGTDSPFSQLRGLADGLWQDGNGVKLALLGLVASHGASFVLNFWIGGERLRSDPRTLMFAPYPRIVTMHVTVLLGGFLTTSAGEPVGLLVALVVAKIAIDAYAHLRERRRLGAADDLVATR